MPTRVERREGKWRLAFWLWCQDMPDVDPPGLAEAWVEQSVRLSRQLYRELDLKEGTPPPDPPGSVGKE